MSLWIDLFIDAASLDWAAKAAWDTARFEFSCTAKLAYRDITSWISSPPIPLTARLSVSSKYCMAANAKWFWAATNLLAWGFAFGLPTMLLPPLALVGSNIVSLPPPANLSFGKCHLEFPPQGGSSDTLS